jgi:hypothetical protein
MEGSFHTAWVKTGRAACGLTASAAPQKADALLRCSELTLCAKCGRRLDAMGVHRILVPF